MRASEYLEIANDDALSAVQKSCYCVNTRYNRMSHCFLHENIKNWLPGN